MSSAAVGEPITVDLAPHEASAGVDKTIALLDGRLVTVRVPAGTVDAALLLLPDADVSDPARPRDVILRARVVATLDPGADRPALPVRPVTAPLGPRTTATGAADPDTPDPDTAQPDTADPDTAQSDTAQTDTADPDTAQPDTAQLDTGDPGDPVEVRDVEDGRPTRRRRRTAVIGVAAAVLVTGSAVGAWAQYRDRDRPGGPAPLSAPANPAPAAYQALLTTADTRLATALRAVGAAKTPTELRDATRALDDALAAQVAALGAAAGPAGAAPAHKALVVALSALRGEADKTSSAAASLAICGSASALPALTGGPAADAVRAAARDLAAQSYMFGSFLPATGAAPTRQATTGTYTKKIAHTGQGRLKITNNGPADAVISLAPQGTDTALFTVYVRTGAIFTVTGIKDGGYQLFEATGVDWDPATNGFTRDCSFQRFESVATFKTTGATYTQWSISVVPPPGDPQGGLAPVAPDHFPG